MSTSAPGLCALCPSWYFAEKQIADRVLADTSRMAWSYPWLSAKWSGSGFLLNGLPDGQRLISAGGFPSEYITTSLASGRRDKTIKNETREGKQSRCLSKSSSLPDLSPYSGDRAKQKLPRGQSNDLVPREKVNGHTNDFFLTVYTLTRA